MDKKIILEEIIRINEIMGINKPKLLMEGIGDFIIKLFDKAESSPGVIKTIDDVNAKLLAKGIDNEVINILDALAKKDVLSVSERQALSSILRELLPEIVEKNILDATNDIETRYGSQALDELRDVLLNRKIPNVKVISWLDRFYGTHGLDEEFIQMWRDDINKIKPVVPKSLDDINRVTHKELEVGEASEFAKSIFKDLEGIELTAEESDLVNKASDIISKGVGGMEEKEYSILISQLEKVGVDLEEGVKVYDSKMKGLDNLKQAQWDSKKRKIYASINKFKDNLRILRSSLSTLKPKSKIRAFKNIMGFIVFPLIVIGAGVTICNSEYKWLSFICDLFKTGANTVVIDPLTAKKTTSDTTKTTVTPVTPVTPANEEQLVRDFAKKEGYTNITSASHNTDGSWKITDSDGETATYKVVNGKVEYQGK